MMCEAQEDTLVYFLYSWNFTDGFEVSFVGVGGSVISGQKPGVCMVSFPRDKLSVAERWRRKTGCSKSE